MDENHFPLLPVITLVLNLSDKRWSGCKSLAQITNIPPEFEPHFQDYKIKVVDVAFLDDAVIERFTSDFRLVAKFFKSRRLGTKPWDDETQIQHVEAFVDFISAFTDDPRYQSAKGDLEKIKAKGEKVGMNDPYLDMLMEKEVACAEQKITKLISYLLTNNMTEEVHEAYEKL